MDGDAVLAEDGGYVRGEGCVVFEPGSVFGEASGELGGCRREGRGKGSCVFAVGA